MPTVKAFIRSSSLKKDLVNIRFRLSDGRTLQIFHKSEIKVPPTLWDNKKQETKAKILFDPTEKARINKAVAARKELIIDIYNSIPAPERHLITSQWLDNTIEEKLNENTASQLDKHLIGTFNTFLETSPLSPVRIKNYRVLVRALSRYEMIRKIKDKNFCLTLNSITTDILSDFQRFLESEHILFNEYPDIYDAIPECRKPQQRGANTINGLFTKFRAFFSWANRNKITDNDPFPNWKINNCIYGTPYYITIEERNKIYRTNLSRHPQLATQRDIFVFQCLVGCRVGDLYSMRQNNIINGAIEYIPRKTKEGRPITVRVPLNSIAVEIVEKYKRQDDNAPLFPYISQQHYNKAIKKIFLAAGITRPVTILNPLTREAEVKPINEVASSHLARRTFVGNLYKQVKDPNLIGALSGHVDGSKAFARYRDIDDGIKRDLVKMLE